MMSRRLLFSLLLLMSLLSPTRATQSSITSDGESWTLQNDVVRMGLTFQSGKGLSI